MIVAYSIHAAPSERSESKDLRLLFAALCQTAEWPRQQDQQAGVSTPAKPIRRFPKINQHARSRPKDSHVQGQNTKPEAPGTSVLASDGLLPQRADALNLSEGHTQPCLAATVSRKIGGSNLSTYRNPGLSRSAAPNDTARRATSASVLKPKRGS